MRGRPGAVEAGGLRTAPGVTSIYSAEQTVATVNDGRPAQFLRSNARVWHPDGEAAVRSERGCLTLRDPRPVHWLSPAPSTPPRRVDPISLANSTKGSVCSTMLLAQRPPSQRQCRIARPMSCRGRPAVPRGGTFWKSSCQCASDVRPTNQQFVAPLAAPCCPCGARLSLTGCRISRLSGRRGIQSGSVGPESDGGQAGTPGRKPALLGGIL